jgi:hypothetical protein
VTRPITGSAAAAGNLDGLVDGTNGRSCDPRGRFIRWHPLRPESESDAYRDAYLAAYERACAYLRTT